MSVNGDMLFLKLAEEVMVEGNLDCTTMGAADFHRVSEEVFRKINLLPREGHGQFNPADLAQDDDQLRSFFLGKSSPCNCSCILKP